MRIVTGQEIAVTPRAVGRSGTVWSVRQVAPASEERPVEAGARDQSRRATTAMRGRLVDLLV